MAQYRIKPEDSQKSFYGNSFEEIAKDNGLVKINGHYYTQSGKKEEKPVKEFSKKFGSLKD